MKQGIDCKGKPWKETTLGHAKNLTDKTFNYLTAVCRVEHKSNCAYWLFKCKCGNEIIARASDVLNGKIHSCGCYKKEYLSNDKHENLIGKVFGKLTVINRSNSTNSQKRKWVCLCECGNITEVTTSALTTGKTKSCGCLRDIANKQRCFHDLSGQKFGELLVLNRISESSKKVYYKCKCSCGNIVNVEAVSLRSGHTRSCGCKSGISLGEEKNY